MLSFKIKDVLILHDKKSVTVLDEQDRIVGEIKKTTVPGNEKGTTFVFEQEGVKATLGIKKGRLLFATYRFQVNGEEFQLKDNTLNSMLYFCVSGTIDGKKWRIDENWDQELDVSVDGKKVALIKPHSFLGADLLIDAEASRHPLLFSLTCLMYFMLKIYREETEFIEDVMEEFL
ncbi:MAG: PRC domain-containing protein [Shouchella clausii]|uniref:hypothetical protein n=1 Tax=Shouchella clausii TaxID=79880 RepID=UPI000BA51F87|nr:hypothetical protein [Shouchella clausii]PAF15519.1 hypothetical protein CHH59_03765 [Shouchella clausii]